MPNEPISLGSNRYCLIWGVVGKKPKNVLQFALSLESFWERTTFCIIFALSLNVSSDKEFYWLNTSQ